MAHRITPLYIFNNGNQFDLRHRRGTQIEFENESKDIEAFNSRELAFRAWVVTSLGKGQWLFLVQPGEQLEWRLPKEGESCELLLLSKSGKSKKWDKYWKAERIDNPSTMLGLPEECQRYIAFKVKMPDNVPEDLIRPLQDEGDEQQDFAPAPLSRNSFNKKKGVMIAFKLSISKATKDAELGSLDKLFLNPKKNRTVKQKAAFDYLMNFKNPRFTVNMLAHFPQLKDPLNNPLGMPSKVVSMLKGFNEHQRIAYRNVLSNLPCGICILPGGPGAGKTHWNLVLTAAIQSKDLTVYGPDERVERSAKVLYLLDINKPLDDTSNKIVKLYKDLGLKKNAVRLYGWHYPVDENGVTQFTGKFMIIARMNRYRYSVPFSETCLAPTLDEAAWNYFQAHKANKYRDLAYNLAQSLSHGKEAEADDFRAQVNTLYKDVLDNIDFIATTPVPAATGLGGLYKPDLVFFDESPHARECSTLIAIAHYEPIAWFFSGDHRQTRPFVASDDVRDNMYAPQMLVSMMERAHRAGAIKHSLLINHRAYGGLQGLASKLFYEGKMITGHKDDALFPSQVKHMQAYLERFLPAGKKIKEPRLIVCSDKCRELQCGTSWYNSTHLDWVMERCLELLQDTKFRRVGKKIEGGTILIIAPYKEAFHRYKKEIKILPPDLQVRLKIEDRLEARTIDTVQGGEADFVFLDFVRSRATEFTDDPNRLCVALTRARQAEIILMHPGMRWCGPYNEPSQYLSRVWQHCTDLGQMVEITGESAPPQLASMEESIHDYPTVRLPFTSKPDALMEGGVHNYPTVRLATAQPVTPSSDYPQLNGLSLSSGDQLNNSRWANRAPVEIKDIPSGWYSMDDLNRKRDEAEAKAKAQPCEKEQEQKKKKEEEAVLPAGSDWW